jgi:hypothetical protein
MFVVIVSFAAAAKVKVDVITAQSKKLIIFL